MYRGFGLYIKYTAAFPNRNSLFFSGWGVSFSNPHPNFFGFFPIPIYVYACARACACLYAYRLHAFALFIVSRVCPGPALPLYKREGRRKGITPAPSFNPINFIDPSINPQGLESQQNKQARPISLFRMILNLYI